MTDRITYDPPIDLPKPSSRADSEALRRMVRYYRDHGKDSHADYLQAILDEREGGNAQEEDHDDQNPR